MSLYDYLYGFIATNFQLILRKQNTCCFSTRQKLSTMQNIPVTYEKQIIDKVSEFNYLRVKLDQYLTISHHANYIISKVIGKIKVLNKLTAFTKTCMMLYKTLVLPHFTYCDLAYNCMSIKDSQMLQKLQNSCIKSI